MVVLDLLYFIIIEATVLVGIRRFLLYHCADLCHNSKCYCGGLIVWLFS